VRKTKTQRRTEDGRGLWLEGTGGVVAAASGDDDAADLVLARADEAVLEARKQLVGAERDAERFGAAEGAGVGVFERGVELDPACAPRQTTRDDEGYPLRLRRRPVHWRSTVDDGATTSEPLPGLRTWYLTPVSRLRKGWSVSRTAGVSRPIPVNCSGLAFTRVAAAPASDDATHARRLRHCVDDDSARALPTKTSATQNFMQV